MDGDLLLVLVVGTALAFDFTNGFHDTANVVATSISTRALPPRVAVGFASVLNFVGAFLSLAVAATVAKGIVAAYRIVGRLRRGPVARGYRAGQIVSGGLLALAHGTNDAQKTMGVMALALVAHGNLPAADPHPPTWVVVSAASAIAAGTYSGGWRIIRTMGTRIIKMDAAQGFTAQGSGAAVILAASHVGFPLSTTHVISGGVMGAGAARRLSAVRWGVAGHIAIALVVTLPAAGAIGAGVYGVTRAFGVNSEAGPLVVAVLIVAGTALVFARRVRRGSPLTAAEA